MCPREEGRARKVPEKCVSIVHLRLGAIGRRENRIALLGAQTLCVIKLCELGSDLLAAVPADGLGPVGRAADSEPEPAWADSDHPDPVVPSRVAADLALEAGHLDAALALSDLMEYSARLRVGLGTGAPVQHTPGSH